MGAETFDTLLIANRGEIACRVIATARKMGLRCVAVYSEPDADARHVALADVAVPIGGPAPKDSYLRGDAIIDAALQTGAQAIHPGYGFLSENPDFVQAVSAAGLIFVGPSARAMRAMALKGAAKAVMAEAGVPIVPGYHGDDQDPGHLEVEAHRVGYPVLIKAVAGGGGKGMRRVDRPEDFVDRLEAAKAEALGAFGNDAVLIEKFVEKPRHIEVQVFGDGTRAVHLFERDCSLQRRHQKVIEEAPAPGMTPEMREAMGSAAVRAAEAIGYAGAGTVEFIVDASDGLKPDRFYFMEMNTRLQVEHPVTEAITGIDLVEWQLRVAAGEALPATQEELDISGHAVEARLYAEDVPKGFLPATGRLTHLVFPQGIRADTGVRPGDEISPWYDPMIAKLIVAAPTRQAALRRLAAALAETEVAGSVTNLGFLRRLALSPDFVSGDVDTGLIDRGLERLVDDPAPAEREWALAAVAALGLDAPPDLGGFALWAPLTWTVALEHGDATRQVSVEVLGDGTLGATIGDTVLRVRRSGAVWQVGAERGGRIVTGSQGEVSVFWEDGFHFRRQDPLAAEAQGVGAGVIEAPMPGLLKRLDAQPGQPVVKGARLAVLEAMKMEHTLTAPCDGKVAEVLAEAGDQVSAGAPLIRLEDAS